MHSHARAYPDFSLRGGKVDRSSAEGALVEAPKAPRGWGYGEGVPPLVGEGSEERVDPLPRNFYYLPQNGVFWCCI